MNKEPLETQLRPLSLATQYNNQDNLPVVIAQACGGGKTFMGLWLAEQYLKKHPNAKVLVLAHGTKVLRRNFVENCEEHEPDFKWCRISSRAHLAERYQTHSVLITLPQTIAKAQLPKFDAVIVDESHQRYWKKQCQKILEKTKPKYQWLLTGSPHDFIRANNESKTGDMFHIIPVSSIDLFDAGVIGDVYVELATTTYPLFNKDYNVDAVLKREYLFQQEDTNSTLDNVLDKIMKVRLGSTFRHPKALASNVLSTSRLAAWKKIGRTMIACHGIGQAGQVYKYCEENGISAVISDWKSDPGSDEIKRFEQDETIQVLIVVDRGVLGFNCHNMINGVDLTCSQNIPRIFQFERRFARPYKNAKKLFIKVVPHKDASEKGLAEYFEYIMTCVLSLQHEDWYTAFDGKNFMQLPIPTKKKNNTMVSIFNTDDDDKPKPKVRRSSKKGVVKEEAYLGAPSTSLMKKIFSKEGIYRQVSWTNMTEIKRALGLSKIMMRVEDFMESLRETVSKRAPLTKEERVWVNRIKTTCNTKRKGYEAYLPHLEEFENLLAEYEEYTFGEYIPLIDIYKTHGFDRSRLVKQLDEWGVEIHKRGTAHHLYVHRDGYEIVKEKYRLGQDKILTRKELIKAMPDVPESSWTSRLKSCSNELTEYYNEGRNCGAWDIDEVRAAFADRYNEHENLINIRAMERKYGWTLGRTLNWLKAHKEHWDAVGYKKTGKPVFVDEKKYIEVRNKLAREAPHYPKRWWDPDEMEKVLEKMK